MNSIERQVQETLPTFVERVLPIDWKPRGILTSEGLAFHAMFDIFNVGFRQRCEHVIESGMASGRSTEMWSRCFGEVGHITSIDWNIDPAVRHRIERLGVEVMDGDTHELLPRKLDQIDRVGARPNSSCVFIDGPKGLAAVELAIECMKRDSVAFVGVHDMSKLIGGMNHTARHVMENTTFQSWFTDEQWFVDASKHLDAEDSQLDAKQGTRWTPGVRHEQGKPDVSLGSYGYTIGFLHKSFPK